MTNNKYDIQDRTLSFAIRVAKIINSLPRTISAIEYGKQLIRSSSSVGANIEKADGTLTKKDFIHKLAIARRESRESRYWLKLITGSIEHENPNLTDELQLLTREAEEIMPILSSIINKVTSKLSQ